MRQEQRQGNLFTRFRTYFERLQKNHIMLGPFEILAASYHTIDQNYFNGIIISDSK
jgi:hypothetical protein